METDVCRQHYSMNNRLILSLNSNRQLVQLLSRKNVDIFLYNLRKNKCIKKMYTEVQHSLFHKS